MNAIQQKGLAATRKQNTATLAQSMALTDELMSQPILSLERAEVAIARGWILQVLEERGELAAIERVREAAEARKSAEAAYRVALRKAVKTNTLAAVAHAAGVSRQAVHKLTRNGG